MNQNFAILGMFDRNNIMSVISSQPETCRFIVAAVDAGIKTEMSLPENALLSREKEVLNNLKEYGFNS